MLPTNQSIFVEKIETNKSNFDVVGNQVTYKVVAIAPDITACQPGDFVLFTDLKEYKFIDKTYLVVQESDIVGHERA